MTIIGVATNQGKVLIESIKGEEGLYFWCQECKELYRLDECYCVLLPMGAAVSIMCPVHKAKGYLGKLAGDNISMVAKEGMW